jgi:hypothetical protein
MHRCCIYGTPCIGSAGSASGAAAGASGEIFFCILPTPDFCCAIFFKQYLFFLTLPTRAYLCIIYVLCTIYVVFMYYLSRIIVCILPFSRCAYYRIALPQSSQPHRSPLSLTAVLRVAAHPTLLPHVSVGELWEPRLDALRSFGGLKMSELFPFTFISLCEN